MDWFLGKVENSLGVDKAAYLLFSMGTIIWVFSFAYVSENDIDSFASNLSRGLALFLFNLPTILNNKFKEPSSLSMTNMIQRHLLLVVFGLVYAQSFFYLSINLIYTISFSGPLFVFVIDYALHRINITKRKKIGVFLACLGMLLSVNGNLIYSWVDPSAQFHTDFHNFKPEASSLQIQLLVCCILIIGQFGWAYSIVLIKKIENANHYQLNCQYGAIMVMFSGCFYQFTTVTQQKRLESFLYTLLFQGLPLAIGQSFFTFAMTKTKNLGVMTMTSFLSVVLSYLFKICRYHEPLNWIGLIGSFLILWGIHKIVIRE